MRPTWVEVVHEGSWGEAKIYRHCGDEGVPCPDAKLATVGFLQLDEQAPRPLFPIRLLSSLLTEDQEIAPGAHQLVASVVAGDAVWLDAVSFRVEPNLPSRPPRDTSRTDDGQLTCALVFPSATLNGREAARLEILGAATRVRPMRGEPFAPVVEAGAEAHYRLVGPRGASEGVFQAGTSAVVDAPAAGDYHVSFSFVHSGEIQCAVARSITINPELTGASP